MTKHVLIVETKEEKEEVMEEEVGEQGSSSGKPFEELFEVQGKVC